MAPPGKKRPGYSRRAQYGLFAAYAAAVAGAVGGLLLVAISALWPQAFSSLRIIGSELISPLSRSGRGIAGVATGAEDALSAYWRAGSQNQALRRELAVNRHKVLEADSLRQQNRQLRALLDVKERSRTVIAAGHLISSTASSSRRYATLDLGTLNGVRSGQPVRGADGIVGRTLEVGPTTARVLLLTDTESVIPALRARDGMPATITGQGDGSLMIQLLETARDTIRAGDQFITSGSGGLYPPNIPVAVATQKGTDNGRGRPFADPASTSIVVVEKAFTAMLAPLPPSAEDLPAKSRASQGGQ